MNVRRNAQSIPHAFPSAIALQVRSLLVAFFITTLEERSRVQVGRFTPNPRHRVSMQMPAKWSASCSLHLGIVNGLLTNAVQNLPSIEYCQWAHPGNFGLAQTMSCAAMAADNHLLPACVVGSQRHFTC